MSLIPTTAAVWKSAQLLIAFYKDKNNQPRKEPRFWQPSNAFAGLRAKPEDQEAFIVLKGEDEGEDVQIKLHPSNIVVRRNRPLGWSGILIGQDSVKVKVDGDLIEIGHDGTVKVTRDADTTYLEGDGSIIKVNPDAEILVSSDGSKMSRRTDEQFDAFTPEGFVSKKRTPE